MVQDLKQPCKNCDKKLPYSLSYAGAQAALQRAHDKTTSVVPLLAIAIKETGTNPWFIGTEELCINNLAALLHETGMTKEQLINCVYKTRVTRVKPVPKFRYEPSWQADAEKVGKLIGASAEEQILLACSWGIGQKSGWIYVAENPSFRNMLYIREFIFSPAAQWDEILRQYKALMKGVGGNEALAFTRYNGPGDAHKVSDYGERVVGIADGVKKLLERNGMKLCLD